MEAQGEGELSQGCMAKKLEGQSQRAGICLSANSKHHFPLCVPNPGYQEYQRLFLSASVSPLSLSFSA